VTASTVRMLRAIDWDFARPRSGYVAPPHWYPGTFVPALSDALIEALTPMGGTVFDPYAGIGTSGWSALRTGRSVHLADVNPVACLASYATTSLLALRRKHKDWSTRALSATSEAAGRPEDLFGSPARGADARVDQLVSETSSPDPAAMLDMVTAGPPNWDALSIWIESSTLDDLRVLSDAVAVSPSSYVRLLGTCMISAVARNVCSQHASWGHIADNVKPREMKVQNVRAAAARWIKRTRAFLEQPMLAIPSDATPMSNVQLRDWSIAGQPGTADADLLLTSPPYADAIDYTLAQRLSLYLLGHDEFSLRGLVANEIGARRKRAKSTSRTEWSQQLCVALIEQLTWLKQSGSVCLVLPHKDSGRSAGEMDLKSTLTNLGWNLLLEQDRSIHQSHTRQSWTSIKKETIIVFRR
jgi:hypothetical protein